MTEIFAILNVTRDSFSDGGRWLEPAAAVERGLALAADGADVIDVGASSTHPDAEDVSAAEELRRLEPVVGPLVEAGLRVSVDTWQGEVAAWAVEAGVEFLNDVSGCADPRTVEALAASEGVRAVVMHSTSTEGRAVRGEPGELAGEDVLARIESYFVRRIEELEAAGVARERLVLDPGMGFFLSSRPEPSLAVLANLRRLRECGPVMISVSRKSFLGAVTGRGVGERGAATLAAELYGVGQGVEYVRTHEPGALRDGMRVLGALGGGAGPAT